MIVNETPSRRATPAEQARVKRWIQHYKREYYLLIVEVNVLFHDYPSNHDAEAADAGAAADIDCDLIDTYHCVTLNIYPRFFSDTREAQEFVIAHEMLHPITWLLARLAVRLGEGQLVTGEEVRQAQERVTDWLARIVFYGGTSQPRERPIRVRKDVPEKKPVRRK